jgi:reticulocyte-binding protein
MSEYICEYCNSKLSTKTNLIVHIKTSKKCLELRNCSTEDIYSCTICNKKFSSKKLFKTHLTECRIILNEKNKYIRTLESSIEELKNKISQLEEENISLKKQNSIIKNSYNNVNSHNNTVINKNIIINYLNKVEEVDLNKLQTNDLSILMLKDPKNFKEEYAKYLLNDTSLKNKLITNNSRSSLTYKENDKIIKDKDGTVIIEKTFLLLKDKILDMINDIIERLNTLEKKDYIVDYIIELKDLYNKINDNKIKNSLSKNILSQAIRVNDLESILKEYAENQPDSIQYITFIKSELNTIEEPFMSLLEYRQGLLDISEEKIKAKRKIKRDVKNKRILEEQKEFLDRQVEEIERTRILEEERIEKERLERELKQRIEREKFEKSINNKPQDVLFSVKNEINKERYKNDVSSKVKIMTPEEYLYDDSD